VRPWRRRWAPRGVQRVCCLFHHPLAADLVDGGLGEGAGDDLPGPVALPWLGMRWCGVGSSTPGPSPTPRTPRGARGRRLRRQVGDESSDGKGALDHRLRTADLVRGTASAQLAQLASQRAISSKLRSTTAAVITNGYTSAAGTSGDNPFSALPQ